MWFLPSLKSFLTDHLTFSEIERDSSCANDASKVYDGAELTNDSYNVSGGKLADGNEIHVRIVGSITDVGSIANVVKGVLITDANGNEVTFNYEIVRSGGTLTVTKPKN